MAPTKKTTLEAQIANTAQIAIYAANTANPTATELTSVDYRTSRLLGARFPQDETRSVWSSTCVRSWFALKLNSLRSLERFHLQEITCACTSADLALGSHGGLVDACLRFPVAVRCSSEASKRDRPGEAARPLESPGRPVAQRVSA